MEWGRKICMLRAVAASLDTTLARSHSTKRLRGGIDVGRFVKPFAAVAIFSMLLVQAVLLQCVA